MEALFFEKLEKDEIEVPYGFYDEDLLSYDPQYIVRIFANLEDTNLKVIRRAQESEQLLE